MIIERKFIYFQIFINNEWHDSVSGKKFPVINPSNEKIIAQVAEAEKVRFLFFHIKVFIFSLASNQTLR